MHKYERILRRTKNEKGSQGLYFNFFNDDKALVFNLNKLKIDKWQWKTMPESTEFSRRKFVHKYVTFIDYSKGKLFYIWAFCYYPLVIAFLVSSKKDFSSELSFFFIYLKKTKKLWTKKSQNY